MNLLLFQPAVLTENDKVFRDGVLLTQFYEREDAYQTIVTLFNGVDNNQYPWMGKVGDFYLIRGLFNDVDEKGRRLSFLFASNDESFWEDLNSVVNSIDQTISDNTELIIASYLEKSKKKAWLIRTIITVGIVVFCLFLVLLLWNLKQTS